MPKPVCVKCQCFFRPKTNGVHWVEGMPDGHTPGNIRGRRAPEAWQPYKLWNSDLWECPDCGHQIIVGHAGQPTAEHYQDDFQAQAVGSMLQVNDC